jgi:hypothetical protein
MKMGGIQEETGMKNILNNAIIDTNRAVKINFQKE